VSKFAADGTPITAWGTGGELSGFETIQGIAVAAPFATLREQGVPNQALGLGIDPQGRLYAGIASFQVAKINDTGAFLGLPDGLTDGRALAVDPSSGDLYVAQENKATQSSIGMP
jgi:hypothetical protein